MKRLSPEQDAASEPRPGPVRVVAGAGTGKTAVIAERYARLLRAGWRPDQILVMTFSERAAAELRDRIEVAAGVDEPAQVGTFHALAQRWLREDGARVGAPTGFRILAGPDRWVMLRELMWALKDESLIGVERPDEMVTPLLHLLERLKQELVPITRLRAWAAPAPGRPGSAQLLAAARLFRAYAAECRRLRLLDFADLLVDAVRLLEQHSDVRSRYTRRLRWLMVDEYQDTNLAQERLVELLAGASANVFVVGDDDQSIYRFRGASRASMERFVASFPATAGLGLGANRRCSGSIVAAARHVISRNLDRIPKEVSAARGPGARVRVVEFDDAEAESAALAAQVARQIAAGVPAGSIAVLTRTHAAARPVVEALERGGIEYQQWSRQGFYERPEVRDIIACLRLVQDPSDLLSLVRAAAAPPVALPVADVVALSRAGAAAGETPLQALATTPTAEDWAEAMLGLAARRGRLGVDHLFFELMERTRYLEAWPAGPERARVVANVSRLGELIDDYCERHADHSLGPFLAHLDLVLLSGEDEDLPSLETSPEAIQVMTIHQAKGLEFESVLVPSLVEGRLPQPTRRNRSEVRFEVPDQILEPSVRGREDHVAEERRLFYVAITRARNRLWLSWARRYEGARPWRRSRFLDDLAELDGGAIHLRAAAARRPAAFEPRPTDAGGPAVAPAAALHRHLQLSFSSVATYRDCPRRYWFRYEQRLPAPPTVDGQYGSVIHDALRRAGEMRREKSLGRAELSAAYGAAWAQVELADPRRRPALEALGWAQLERFHAAGGLDRPPEMVEQAFTADLDTWSLRGIIDRVDGPPPPTLEGGVGGQAATSAAVDGEPWRLVDYKTGSPLPVSSLRRDLQLALYAFGAREALGLSNVELEIVYLQTGRSVRLPGGEDLIEQARAVCEEVAAGIRAGSFEPRPDRRRCRVCAYRMACRDGL